MYLCYHRRMNKTNLLSIIIPAYGDKNLVKILYEKLTEAMSQLKIDYEIILVNDACPYGSGEEIEKLASKDKKVKFIDLSRNFGQHYAIKAGIDYAKGDYAVIMDCDLQDDPKDIIKLYEKINSGFDIVFAARAKRKDSLFKKFLSKAYYFVEKKLTDYSPEYNIGTFSIINKKVLSEFKKINDYNFNYMTVINWLGFKKTYIDIERDERLLGKSNYNLYKGLNLALKSIISNSNKPLIFAAFCSFFMFILSFCFVIKLFLDYYILKIQIMGWTSIMVSIFFVSGLLFAYLGILGLYIGGIFKEIKTRPLYVVKKTINLD